MSQNSGARSPLRGRAARAAKGARRVLWEELPAIGRTEIALRSQLLRRKLWDLEFVRSLPPSPLGALDVGANIGLYSRELAKNHGFVEAFEPNPGIHRRLARSSPPNVRTWPVAVSDGHGEVCLSVPVSTYGEVSGQGSIERDPALWARVNSYSVPSLPLDSLFFRPVRLLKIDVEGHELAVLRGARTLIRESPQLTILLEAEERHSAGSPQQVASLLGDHGFSGFFVFEDRVLDASAYDPDVHQRPDSIGSSRKYCNMFVYVRDQVERTREMLRASIGGHDLS